jgi:hypothetical protein
MEVTVIVFPYSDTYIRILNNGSYRGIISSSTYSKWNKLLFPDKKGSTRPYTYMSEYLGYKYCGNCNTFKLKKEFRANSSRKDNSNSYCITCHQITTSETQSYRQSIYRSKLKKATPAWADLEAIKQIYKNRPEGYHVDHIVPINNPKVCGLHVEYNLQYLLAEDNLKKSNKI